MDSLLSIKLSSGKFEVYHERPSFSFLEVKQTHSNLIISSAQLPNEGDGIITLWDNLSTPLLIKTADCMPIIIEGEEGACFIHAGWKGLNLGILKNPIIKSIKPTSAFIGPSIHSCCFEVSEDFLENFSQSPYFSKKNSSYYFDLINEAKDQLMNEYSIKTQSSPICTCCNLNYHSYRRDKTIQRNFNVYRKG
jgi:hypothetical protein